MGSKFSKIKFTTPNCKTCILTYIKKCYMAMIVIFSGINSNKSSKKNDNDDIIVVTNNEMSNVNNLIHTDDLVPIIMEANDIDDDTLQSYGKHANISQPLLDDESQSEEYKTLGMDTMKFFNNHIPNNHTDHTNTDSDVTIYMDIDTIIHNLKLLANLTDGQKPWLSDNKLIIYEYSHWFPGMRWMYSQSRTNIMPCVKATIMEALIMYKKEKNNEIWSLLKLSVSGLNKLKITYSTETNVIDTLIKIINDEIV